jgi:hypothetical protein
MLFFIRQVNALFDTLDRFWESSTARRWIMWLLVAIFFLTLLVVEANRLSLFSAWLPAPFVAGLPTNHFYAINLVFTVLLIIEIASLALSIAGSVANALGKQFEILSLILLRQAFKEFVYFDEPIVWEKIQVPVLHMLSDAGGSLVLFFGVWMYYRIQTHRSITSDPEERYRFVTAKKTLSLVLLVVFFVLGVVTLGEFLFATPHGITQAATETGQYSSAGFFDAFYTALVFSDILLVLISLRYSSSYPIVFRNSGFALATVFIRLALTAPPYLNIALASAALTFAIGLSFAYRTFAQQDHEIISSI